MLYSKNDDVRYTMMCKECDEEFWKPENKSKFIGHCMLNDIEFLDPVDEVKND